MRQALGDCEELPDDWVTTATVIRETGGEVFGVSFRQMMDDKETWWWDEEVEEVEESIQRKRLTWKKCESERAEER